MKILERIGLAKRLLYQGNLLISVVLQRLPGLLKPGGAVSTFGPLLASFMLIRGWRLFAPCRGVFGVEPICTC
jgi:hypothetical protein